MPLERLLEDLIRLNVSVVFARGPQALAVAKKASNTIPIVTGVMSPSPMAAIMRSLESFPISSTFPPSSTPSELHAVTRDRGRLLPKPTVWSSITALPAQFAHSMRRQGWAKR
jgi:hypothetical protein